MKIGVSTACLYPNLIEDSLRILGESGVNNTEIFLNTMSEMQPEFINELCLIKEEYGMNIASLHPFTSGYEGYMLFQNYSRRVRDCFDMYRRYFSVAARLGAKIFVLHGDKIGGKLPVYDYCERFAKLSDVAEYEGVLLTQENVNLFRASDPDFIKQMIDNLGKKAAFTFDVKQCVRSGHSPWEIYDAMRGHIAHIHLSDHNENNDCLLPGKGEFDFAKLFRIALADGFDGSALVEVYSNAFIHNKELATSCEKLIKIKENLY